MICRNIRRRGEGLGICVISLGEKILLTVSTRIWNIIWFQFEDILNQGASLVSTHVVCKRLSVMQSLAQCDKNVVKITQNKVFFVKNNPPPSEVEVLMGNFVHGTGVWRLIAVSPRIPSR